MRSKIGKTLRKEFDLRLRNTFPQFSEDKSSVKPPGCRDYVWKLKNQLSAFISLICSPKGDSFTIDIAWTTNDKYPDRAITYPEDSPQDGNSRFRLSQMYGSKRDYWWQLSKEMSIDDDFFTFEEEPVEVALSRIDPALDDVFDKIEKYVMPYFDRLSHRT